MAVQDSAKISAASRAEFEVAGTHHVRKCIEFAIYSAEKRQEAHEWLAEKERALEHEQMSIARGAKDAAWAAERAAHSAKRRATIAVAIASISVLAAVASVVVSLLWKPVAVAISFE